MPRQSLSDKLPSLALFHSSTLKVDHVASAVTQLEEHVNVQTAHLIVSRALEQPYCLEFILSAVKPSLADMLTRSVVLLFPETAAAFTVSNTAVQCLQKFSDSLPQLQYPDVLETSKVERHRLSVTRFPLVLAELSRSLPEGSPKSRVRNKGRLSEASINESFLMSLGVTSPRTVDEAVQIQKTLLNKQLESLKFLLDLARSSELADQLRVKYLQTCNIGSQKGGPHLMPLLSYTATTGAQYGLRPLQANLTYSSPTDFGPWKMLTTDHIRKKMEKIRRGNYVVFDSIQKRLRELSNGCFTTTNYKKITGPTCPVDIFEARLPGDNRLIYQVDCIQESDEEIPHQVLLLFGIFDHAEIARISWDAIGKQQGRRGKVYQEACRFRSEARQGQSNIYTPGSFSGLSLDPDRLASYSGKDCEMAEGLSKAAVQEIHNLLVLGKHAVLSQPFLDSLLDGHQASPVYQLSPREREAVNCVESCLVHGRSGTGKTTAISFKIFGIERAWAELSSIYPTRPRQLFVSKSLHLVLKMEHEYLQLARLDALAEHAPPHFVERARRSSLPELNVLFNAQDLGVWRAGIPSKFSDLKDADFPLFLTVDELCTMLSNSLPKPHQSAYVPSRHVHTSLLSSLYRESPLPEYLSYDKFISNYWPQFPQQLRKATAPSVAFSEFIGVIKGSEESLGTALSALNRETYDRRRVRRVRYDDFEVYTKLLRKHGDRDVADRTHDLLRALSENPFPGKKVDFLYADEVQDNLLIDTILLRQICRNSDGLFWAGDVAQTISFGSAFQFEELTAFLYRFEAEYMARGTKPKPLKRFQLSINYRSPGGVVDCAHSIIELLQLFPRAVDALDRERGIVDGLKPLLVHVQLSSDMMTTFFSVDGRGEATIGLGAKQCILVRDDAARERLKNSLGEKIGVILFRTLYQSKGLEFDDVLLYNFFNESYTSEEVWQELFDKARARPKDGKLVGSMMFEEDDKRYASLAMELRFLYVAITRTRKNLWIVDSSSCCIPIKNYWTEKGLVDLATEDISISRFADSSASQDWNETAIRMFQQRQYDESAPAFERAGDERRARMARALVLKQRADQASRQTRRDAYTRAAAALVDSAKEAQDDRNERIALFVAVADCFVNIGDHKHAANAFAQAQKWTEAAAHYFDAQLLDKAVHIAKTHANKVNAELSAHILGMAKSVYLDTLRVDDASQLFETEEAFEAFMDDNGFVDARIMWLKKRKDYRRAALLLFEESRVLDAVRLLSSHAENPDNCSLAWDFGLRLLSDCLSLGSPIYAKDRSRSKTALDLLNNLPFNTLTQETQLTFEMFSALNKDDVNSLKRLSVEFHSLGRIEELVLCLARYFALVDNPSEGDAVEYVEMFHTYAKNIFRLLNNPAKALRDNPEKLSRLLGFHLIDRSFARLYEHTIVGTMYQAQKGKKASLERISMPVLARIIRSSLSLYLKGQIERETLVVEALRKTLAPCVNLVVSDKCEGKHELPVAHVLDQVWHARRVRLYLKQIAILDIAHSLPHGVDSLDKRIIQQRKWIAALESAINPLVHLHGSWSSISAKDLSTSKDGLAAVKKWSLDILFNLDPVREGLEEAFVTNFLNAAKMGLRLESDGTHVIKRHLESAPFFQRKWADVLWEGEATEYRKALFDVAKFLLAIDDVGAGIEFLFFVALQRLPLDFRTLCDFADRLTGLFILTRARATAGSLHQVTLPRSWVVELWPEYLRFAGKNVGDLDLLISALKRLLIDISCGDYVPPAIQYADVDDLPDELCRDICMSRICRDLSLLGCALEDTHIRARILGVMTNLRQSPAMPEQLVFSRPYFSAETWQQMQSAVQNSCEGAIGDRMLVFHRAEPAQVRQIDGSPVFRVNFTETAEIPALLDFQALGTLALPSTAAPTAMSLPEPHAHADRSPATGSDSVHEQDSALGKLQHKAAELIQRAWRLRVALLLEEHHWINVCRASDSTVGHSYRPAFVVHLPRLMRCLDWALARAQEELHSAIERRKEARGKEKARHIEAVKVLKPIGENLKQLRKLLDPAAKIHRKTSALVEVGNRAREVEDLVTRLPGAPAEIVRDMKLTLRGFRVDVSQKTRRILNTSDL